MPQLSGWTLVFAFDRQGRVLLIRRSAHKKFMPGIVNGIGGRIEPHDATPEAAAEREMLEETGLRPGPLRLHGTMLVQRNYRGQRPQRQFIYLFSTHLPKGKLQEKCPEGELFWCPPKDFPKFRFSPEFAIYWPHILEGQKVFHVWAEYDEDQPGKIVLM